LGGPCGRLRSLHFGRDDTRWGGRAGEEARGWRVGRVAGAWVLGQDAQVLPYEVRHGDGRRAWAHPPLYCEWGEVWEKGERQGDVVPPEVGEDRL